MKYDETALKHEVQRKIQDFEKSGRRLAPGRIAREIYNDHAHALKPTAPDYMGTWAYIYLRGVVDEQLKRRQN